MSGICLLLGVFRLSYLLQNDSVKQRLTQAQLLWSNMEEKLSHMVLNTVRASQTLEYYSGPRLSLQALTDLHEKLQVFYPY